MRRGRRACAARRSGTATAWRGCGAGCGYAGRVADRYRIPLSTLRQWEQGVREPDGAARLLLRVIEAHPDLVAAVAAREAA